MAKGEGEAFAQSEAGVLEGKEEPRTPDDLTSLGVVISSHRNITFEEKLPLAGEGTHHTMLLLLACVKSTMEPDCEVTGGALDISIFDCLEP